MNDHHVLYRRRDLLGVKTRKKADSDSWQDIFQDLRMFWADWHTRIAIRRGAERSLKQRELSHESKEDLILLIKELDLYELLLPTDRRPDYYNWPIITHTLADVVREHLGVSRREKYSNRKYRRDRWGDDPCRPPGFN